MVSTSSHRTSIGIVVLLALAVGVLALVAVGAVATYQWQYSNRIYEGVYSAGIPLGGLTLDEATKTIQDALAPFPGKPISLRYEQREWLLSAADLGITVNPAATAGDAFRVGRDGIANAPNSLAASWAGIQDDLAAQWSALRYGFHVSPTLNLNEDQLALTLRYIAEEINLPAQEGSLVIAGLEVNGLPGRNGRQVDFEATWAALSAQAKAGAGGTVTLVVHERRPTVMAVDAAVAQAKELLNRSISLVANGMEGEQRFAVDAAQLGRWLSITPRTNSDGDVELGVTLDRDQIAAFVQTLAVHIDRPALDAVLDFERKSLQVMVLQPSQAGQSLDVASSVAAIEAALAQTPQAAPDPSAENGMTAPQEVILSVQPVAPRIDSDKIAEMGVVEQISEGTTYFAGSNAARVHNITNTVGKFHGVVVPPGEQFSFYQVVGDVTLANGFVDSLVIVGDRTEVGVGGGVCQVSTTMYRAAFWGGFPILERYPHGYVVGWYGEPGWDASIFTPDADFRFLNDTGHYLLIKPEIDLKRGRLTFHIYGTKNRSVEAEKGVISNVRPAPTPLYREDADLPTGTIQQVDWAKEGMDVTVKRIIRYDDGRVKEDSFTSKYRPWQAVYLYGPGTALPPEATP